MLNIKPDCRYFNGEKPCRFKRLCAGCTEYSPMGTRVLIIKLAAMGDVLRTTPLLPAIKARYPVSHITWVVDAAAHDLLKGHPLIDRLFVSNADTRLQLEVETFDTVYSLDKDPRAAALAIHINGAEKKGFGWSPLGNVFPLNPESEYAVQLGVDDELKFRRNRKTYQEIIFEAAGYQYERQPYGLFVTPEESQYARAALAQTGLPDGARKVGICPGAGPLFANKSWTIEGYAELIDDLSALPDTAVLLLGGKAERERNAGIKKRLRGRVYDPGNDHPIREFSAIIKECDLLVAGDTLPMHIAIGHGKPVLGIFGPTCPQEIDLYGRGEIVMSPIDCAPCYRRACDIVEHCMTRIPAALIKEKTRRLLKETARC